ncbi:hypothetical protein JTE90_013404 [Oedothorax gibbosus]|uniref:Uncharacterized protein n=1 Tax=Oedothorax gibbosus TaxID=931172 RepID=A0AAV6TWL0_9ARAC|nr:hypothetical protein JTE90_013404 [Oedothorax gibbosus]
MIQGFWLRASPRALMGNTPAPCSSTPREQSVGSHVHSVDVTMTLKHGRTIQNPCVGLRHFFMAPQASAVARVPQLFAKNPQYLLVGVHQLFNSSVFPEVGVVLRTALGGIDRHSPSK